LASAIVEGVGARRPGLATMEAASVEAVIGYGVRATVGGAEVTIGKPGLFTRDGTLPQSVTDAESKLDHLPIRPFLLLFRC
jgi:Cu+-exporting ATPase